MIISGDDPVSRRAQRFEVSTSAGNRLGNEDLVRPPEPDATMFVPAVIEPNAFPVPAPVRRARRRHRLAAAAVELEIDGVAVRIGRGADAGVIAAVIEALRGPR